MEALQKPENTVHADLLKKWRRDIVNLPPVIKINSKGENIVGHTAPNSLEIPLHAISAFTGAGEMVLDPFAGSGTTLDAAESLGRHWIGIDQSAEAIDVMQKRLEDQHGLFIEYETLTT